MLSHLRLLVVALTALFPLSLPAGPCCEDAREEFKPCLQRFSEQVDTLESYRMALESRNEDDLLELADYFDAQEDENISCIAVIYYWMPYEIYEDYAANIHLFPLEVRKYFKWNAAGINRQKIDKLYEYIERRYFLLQESVINIVDYEGIISSCDDDSITFNQSRHTDAQKCTGAL